MSFLATCPCEVCSEPTVLRGVRLCPPCHEAIRRLELLLVGRDAAMRTAREYFSESPAKWTHFRDWLAAQPLPAGWDKES